MNQEQMNFVFSDDLNMDDLFHFQHGYNVCPDITTYDYSRDLFTKILIFMSIIQFSVFISFTIVGVFVYKPMLEKSLNEAIDFDFPEEPYEYKYNLKGVKHDNDEVNPNSYVCETTPQGVVFMKYDKDEEGFVYWSDKQIRFKYLDTVARKYVKFFCCKNFYIPNNVYDEEYESEYDTDEEYDQLKKHESEYDADEERSENENISSNEVSDYEDVNDVFLKKPIQTSSNTTKTEVVKEEIKRNKFIHKGKVAEFMLTKKYEPEEVVTKKKMTFDTFKDLFYGKTTE